MTVSPHSDPAIDAIIAGVRGRPIAMLNVARSLLLPKGRIEQARVLSAEAVALAPADPEVLAHARTAVEDWYFTMVQDQGRHKQYAEAFRQRFPRGCTVLDIGAGTGLFAMLAVREGAGRVIACERDPVVAEAARRVIEQNGMTDRITVVAKDSKDLQIGIDLDEQADALLWDNLANNLMGAGGFDTVEDAKRRLIKPDAPIIPARAEILVALVEDLSPETRTMGTVDGFDMTPFNTLSRTNFTIKPSLFPRRSNGTKIFDIDFEGSTGLGADRALVAVTATGGRVHGISQWLRFHLSDGVIYDTSAEGVTAFGSQFHATAPVVFSKGDEVIIGGSHDRLNTWFWIVAE